MELAKLLHLDLIEVPLEASNAEDAIRQLGNRLVEAGCVDEQYVTEVVNREKIFPTGLPTCGVSVAIPHTAADFVKESVLGIGVLNHPVTFGMMGNPEQTVEAKLIFLLAIQNGKNQVAALQQLVGIFQNESTLHAVAGAQTREGVYRILLQELMPLNSASPGS